MWSFRRWYVSRHLSWINSIEIPLNALEHVSHYWVKDRVAEDGFKFPSLIEKAVIDRVSNLNKIRNEALESLGISDSRWKYRGKLISEDSLIEEIREAKSIKNSIPKLDEFMNYLYPPLQFSSISEAVIEYNRITSNASLVISASERTGIPNEGWISLIKSNRGITYGEFMSRVCEVADDVKTFTFGGKLILDLIYAAHPEIEP